MAKQTLIVITGPTAVGKTDIVVNIAEHYSIPIINADSRQIYREIPIGTAAPTIDLLKRVKHYFVGNHSVTDYYSSSIYEQDVLTLLSNNLPTNFILSGGSMMYIDAVCKGIDNIPTINSNVRNLMMEKLSNEGLDYLSNELKKIDYEYWKIVDKKNARRVVHALEICYQTGKTYTSFRTNTIKKRPFNIIKIGINRDRQELYERINKRTIEMFNLGVVNEAKKMYEYRHLNSLNTVGYKELFDYLDGLTTLEETIMKIQSNTRRYARKQLTWLKKDKDIRWFHPQDIDKIIGYISKTLDTYYKNID